MGRNGSKYVLPILSRLVPDTGNTNKLIIALAQLLQLAVEEEPPMDEVMPWMGKRLVTDGGVAQWLQQEFT